MDRISKFNWATDISRDLLIKIYGTFEKYLSPVGVSPLEEYIFSFDDNCDHMGIIIALGERIGFMLNMKEDFETSVDFYSKISEVIDKKNGDPMIKYIINVDEKEFGLSLIHI